MLPLVRKKLSFLQGKRKSPSFCLFLLLVSLPLLSSPIEKAEQREINRKLKEGHHLERFDAYSYLDWTEGKIYVHEQSPLYPALHKDPRDRITIEKKALLSLSEARSKAQELTEEKARVKLLSLTYNVCLDSESLVKERMRQDKNFQKRMGEIRSRFRIESQRTGANYVSTKLSLPFRSARGLYALLVENSDKRLPLPLLDPKGPRSSPFISGLIFIIEEKKDFQSSLYPRLYSREGLLFYSPEIAASRYTIQRGPITYYNSLEHARKDPRAGTHPYIAYVANLRGIRRSDLVIHDKDLSVILGSLSGRKALRQARVILVISRNP